LGNTGGNGKRLKITRFVALMLAVFFHRFSFANANCGPATLEKAVVERVTTDGDIILRDSRKLKLVGLHLVKPEAVQSLKAGETIAVGLLGSSLDRWSRYSALIFTGPSQQEWLQEKLIIEGAALARPDDELGACWLLLTGIERKTAATIQNPSTEAGRYTRIEGRVLRISDGRTARFISVMTANDGRVAGMILKQHFKRFSDNGVDVDKLRGQIIRLRGVRNIRNASIIPLTSVDQIEIMR
jgi:hypothetical protein